jgi:hypothetical protein
MPLHARQLPNDQPLRRAIREPDADGRDASAGGIPPDAAEGHVETVASAPLGSRVSSELVPERDVAAGANAPWYRREAWLAVQLLAVVPMAAGMFVPRADRIPYFALGGMLVAVGLALLVRQEVRGARASSRDASRAA